MKTGSSPGFGLPNECRSAVCNEIVDSLNFAWTIVVGFPLLCVQVNESLSFTGETLLAVD